MDTTELNKLAKQSMHYDTTPIKNLYGCGLQDHIR